jgi:uncharacterized protein YcgI (DUF1989 family)
MSTGCHEIMEEMRELISRPGGYIRSKAFDDIIGEVSKCKNRWPYICVEAPIVFQDLILCLA